MECIGKVVRSSDGHVFVADNHGNELNVLEHVGKSLYVEDCKKKDTTPLTWDEICEIVKFDDFSKIFMLGFSRGQLGECIDTLKEEHALAVRIRGRLNFKVNKYWRSKESLAAWIEQQKKEE